MSEKRLSLTPNGNVSYQLKTPYRDGTTHVIFESLDLMARRAALVPESKVNLTRFHGVFAPNSKHRARVSPAKRGRGGKPKAAAERQEQTLFVRRAALTWVQRFKRVFGIDIETCRECGCAVRIMRKALAALGGLESSGDAGRFLEGGVELCRISGWWQAACPRILFDLAVDHGREGRLSFLYSRLSFLPQLGWRRTMDLEELANQLTPLIAQRLLVTASIFGDASRIKVPPNYCFNNTLFNTISGDITIGPDVCFGHNVCLLTGTHDISKKNRERIDAYPRNGRDIIIRRGAWLASNVTVLGPCEIGENAVIAAGSLVMTDVKPNCVYAGIPAKFVREIRFDDAG